MLALVNFQNWGLADIAIAVVVIGAVIALVLVALRQFNLAIPQWVSHVFWICVVACVCILAIRFVLGV